MFTLLRKLAQRFICSIQVSIAGFWGQLLSPHVLLWHQAAHTTEHLYNWNYSQVGHGRFSVLDLKSIHIKPFKTTSPSVGRSPDLRLVQFLHLKQHRVKSLHRQAYIFLHYTPKKEISHRSHKHKCIKCLRGYDIGSFA